MCTFRLRRHHLSNFSLVCHFQRRRHGQFTALSLLVLTAIIRCISVRAQMHKVVVLAAQQPMLTKPVQHSLALFVLLSIAVMSLFTLGPYVVPHCLARLTSHSHASTLSFWRLCSPVFSILHLSLLWTSYGKHVCPGHVKTVSWGPLNSHLPLLEGVGDFINLAPAQLEAFDVSRKYRMAINTSQHTQAQRETDPDGWKEKQRNWSLTRDKDLQAASHNKDYATNS
jgi:hypothetical protein